MQGNVIKGAKFLLSGLQIILQPGFKRFILVPIIINFIIFSAIVYFTATKIWMLFSNYTSDFPLWATYILGWALWIAFTLATLLVTATLFVFITNFVASPFYGLLAEKAEILLVKQVPPRPTNFKSLIMDIPHALGREVRKYLYYMPWLILILILFIFPLTLPLAPFAWFLIMAWIITIEYVDYTADNQKIHFKTMLKCLKKEPLTVLGFGVLVSISISLPVLNLIIPTAAVVGGCKLWLHLQEKYTNYQS